jgi:hypothetical protein
VSPWPAPRDPVLAPVLAPALAGGRPWAIGGTFRTFPPPLSKYTY